MPREFPGRTAFRTMARPRRRAPFRLLGSCLQDKRCQLFLSRRASEKDWRLCLRLVFLARESTTGFDRSSIGIEDCVGEFLVE